MKQIGVQTVRSIMKVKKDSELYINWGIYDGIDIISKKPNEFPTFDDLIKLCRKKEKEETHDIDKRCYHILSIFLQKFEKDGAYSRLWNGHTSFAIKDTTLKAYAMGKDKCKEKKSTYFILLGQSSVNPLIKLTVKKDTTVALFKMEDEYFKDIRRNAGSDGTKMKIKETELIVSDAQAFDTAKEMIDLREDQIERYQEYLKEQKSMKR